MAPSSTGARIEAALQPLIGMPFRQSHRGADLQVLHFGDLIDADSYYGNPVKVGEYGLHVGCTWRIRDATKVLVGRRDLYVRAGEDPYRDFDSFDWEHDANRRDERMAAFLCDTPLEARVVTGVSADDLGGFQMTFSGGCALEVFPDDSDGGEHWRLLRPATEEPHFVVTGGGIEY